jgi:hypothetical protein
LINSLERLGITECPRYYSREYEQPRENGILEDDEEELLIPLEVHSAPEDDSPRE